MPELSDAEAFMHLQIWGRKLDIVGASSLLAGYGQHAGMNINL